MNEEFLWFRHIPSSLSTHILCVTGMGILPYSYTLVFGILHHSRVNILISVNAKNNFYKGVQVITTEGSLRFRPSSASS